MNVGWNQTLFLWLNAACTALPDWLWASLTITSHTSMVFALLAPLLLPRVKRGSVIVTGLFSAALLGGIVSTVVKESLQVLRPPAILPPESFHLIGHKLELVSFPSGHTLSAFAIAALLILGLPLRGWRLAGAIVLACLIGLSRIAVGAHWPLDVFGGSLLGIGCGWAGWKVALKLHKTNWTQHVIYPSCQAGIILLVSASLFFTKMGYPEAQLWQYAVALAGLCFSSYSLLLWLRLNKLNVKK
jgi:membrane-associated phospholipid phosphatase